MRRFCIIAITVFLISSSSIHQVGENWDLAEKYDSSNSIEASNLTGADWPWAHGCSCSFDDMVDGDDGDLYVTGTFSDNMTLGDHTLTSQGSYDIFIGKVHPTGEWDWVVQAGGEGNDQGRFIAKTDQSNIVVYGFFQGTATFGSTQHTATTDSGSTVGTGSNRDVFISLLDEEGVWQWTRTAGGSNGYGDEPGGLAVDSHSNIYIAGSFVGDITLGSFSFVGEGNFDGFVAKLTRWGEWVFANHIGGNYNQEPMQLSIENDVGVIVYGTYTDQAVFDSLNLSTDGHTDVFVAKLGLSGAWEWVNSAGGPYAEDASAVDVDSFGNILIAGEFRGDATFGDHSLESPVYMEREAFLAKLNPEGEWTWSMMIDKAPDTDLRVRDIVFDPNGDILIVGQFEEYLELNITNLTSYDRDDLFLASLGQDGQWQWGVAYGGNGWDNADLIAIDDAANIYVGGSYYGSIQIEDHFLNQTDEDAWGSFVGVFQIDTDGDGYNDGVDDFPLDPDRATDSDGDGVDDNEDLFPNDPNEWSDADGDGVGDNADAFPEDSNESVDSDGDGIGNHADLDDDGDGYADVDETTNCVPSSDPLDPESKPNDLDRDGLCDNQDLDIDDDGWSNSLEEQCGTSPDDDRSVPSDFDGDEQCDQLDIDDDADDVSDFMEIGCGSDPFDSSSLPADTDADGVCDVADEDDDGDGWSDASEVDCDTDPLNETSVPIDENGNSICDFLEEYNTTETNESDGQEIDENVDSSVLAKLDPLIVTTICSLVVIGIAMAVYLRRPSGPAEQIQSEHEQLEAYVAQLVQMGYPEADARQYAHAQFEAQGAAPQTESSN